jgi:hypothetical protein
VHIYVCRLCDDDNDVVDYKEGVVEVQRNTLNKYIS